MLPGLERSPGQSRLPGAGLQQVSWTLLITHVQAWRMTTTVCSHRGTYFQSGQQRATSGGGFLRLKSDFYPEASILQQFVLTCGDDLH